MSTTGGMPGVGDVVAGYRIDEVVGSGGMGTVYRAVHERLGREVAVKILRPELASDPEYRARFEREAKIAAQLEHPNIVPLLDFGEQDGALYLVMRFVHGHDLRSLLSRVRALDAEQTTGILGQVASALDAAHEQGLVHRDVKPANILVGAASASQRAGHAYLTDFGIAKDTGTGGGTITSPGTFVGTHHYASPEQIDAKAVDGRADQYALGCIAYECLTGSAPYERDSDSAVMMAHLLEAPPSARAALESLPAGVDAVIAKALAKSPGGRYRTCSEMVDALQQQLPREIPAASTPPAQPPVDSPTPGADETGIRLERKAEKPARRGETELLAGGDRRRQPTPPEPSAPTPEPTPSRRETPRRSAVEPPPEPLRAPRRPPSRDALLRIGAAGLALLGIAALALAAATHGGGKSPAPTLVPTARADSLNLGGQSRYTIPTRKLVANDRGQGLRIVGVTADRTLRGALSLSRNGTRLVYVPDGGFNGSARFSYTVRDRAGHAAVGTVILHIHGLNAAQRALLSYVPSDVLASCHPAGAFAVSCRSTLGGLTFVSYSTAARAEAAFKRIFTAAAGDCTSAAATGTWFWPQTPKRDAGRYGCTTSGNHAELGWTYREGRYFARLAGKPGVKLAALSRWFFAGARLKR